jgi:NAD(P)-dependent dehydrogenase (short-subunit alcohol dehydrogenase family)
MDLRNCVVVTGGSQGLGLDLVEALVAHGARVTVVVRSAHSIDAVRARLGVDTVCSDVTGVQQVAVCIQPVRSDV